MSRKRSTARAGLVIIAGTLSAACVGTGVAAAQVPLPTPSLPPLPTPTTPAPSPSSSADPLPVPVPTGALPTSPGSTQPPVTDPPGSVTPTRPGPGGGSTAKPRSKTTKRPARGPSEADLSRAGGFGYAAPPAFGALTTGSYFDSGVPGLGLPSVATWAPAAQGSGFAPVTAGDPQAAGQLDPVSFDLIDPMTQHRNLLLLVGFTLVAGVTTAHFKVATLADAGPKSGTGQKP